MSLTFSTQSFRTTTLEHHPWGEAVRRILKTALEAVQPARLLQDQVWVENEVLRIASNTYPLHKHSKKLLLAIGKASLTMAQAWLELPGMPPPDAGLAVVKHITDHNFSKIPVVEGSHPVPDERSLEAGQRVKDLLSGLSARDLVVCLISGGGSALVVLPSPGVSLADIRSLTEALLRCGATIAEINLVRRHLDLLKGGGLARLAFPARVLTLILSDVPGNSLETVASGMTAPDPTTVQEARAIFEKYRLHQHVPPSVLQGLTETLKPGDPVFARVQNTLIGSNVNARQAAWRQAQAEGFHTCLLEPDLQGEACEAARMLCAVLRRVHTAGVPVPRPACLIAGGETTVTLGKSSGRGGRNQELALAAVNELAGLPNVMLVTLATDGEDGPTDAAGAVVTGETARRANMAGLDPDRMLAYHDSCSFFTALGDAIKIGPTGTNVNDLVLLFAF